MQGTKLNILLVEDCDDDVFFLQQVTRVSSQVNSFRRVSGGAEAIMYLKRDEPYADLQKYPMPNVILLDLKMPDMDGFEVLEWLFTHPECAVIPVIVYSGSKDEKDVRKAYKLGANAYFVKPSTLREVSDFLLYAYEFWSRCECFTPVGGCK